MKEPKNYDIIIVGAGAAGLSLATEIATTPELSELQVLLLDKAIKKNNDRTWCFWEDKASVYDKVLHASWDSICFYSSSLEKKIEIAPYKYKMLRSADYYKMSFDILSNASNVEFVNDTVISESADDGEVIGEKDTYVGNTIFSSKLPQDLDFSNHLYVDQHFGGWFIKSESPIFDKGAATFMDFRIDQSGEVRFLYVLPVDDHNALVEVAIFSNNHLNKSGYDQIIKKYIDDYYSHPRYEILEKEYGIIPMTNYPFWNHNKGKLYHIGTAGGAVKPSSGYAFKRIQRHSKAIVNCLKNKLNIDRSYDIFKGRHLLYDAIMLDVLVEQGISGERIFTDLFNNTEATRILQFLDGETTFIQDFGIFKAPPMWPFVKGMGKVLRSN